MTETETAADTATPTGHRAADFPLGALIHVPFVVDGAYQPLRLWTEDEPADARKYIYAGISVCYRVTSPLGNPFHYHWRTKAEAERFARSMGAVSVARMEAAGLRFNKVNVDGGYAYASVEEVEPYWFVPAWGRVADADLAFATPLYAV